MVVVLKSIHRHPLGPPGMNFPPPLSIHLEIVEKTLRFPADTGQHPDLELFQVNFRRLRGVPGKSQKSSYAIGSGIVLEYFWSPQTTPRWPNGQANSESGFEILASARYRSTAWVLTCIARRDPDILTRAGRVAPGIGYGTRLSL